MTKQSMFEGKFKRRRECKTDYRKRLAMVKSGKPRLIARKTDRYIMAQVVNYFPKGDVVAASANSRELEKFGWLFGKKNLSAAYLTGMLVAQRAKKKNISEAIFDLGLQANAHGARIFAVLKGALDGGMKIPHDAEVIPKAERISGKHIENYAKAHPNSKQQFSEYAKKKISAENIPAAFENAKRKITENGGEQK